MLHGQRIVVVLPAYKAEKTLKLTVEAIPADIVDEILLVDDASNDGTIGIARSLNIPEEQVEKWANAKRENIERVKILDSLLQNVKPSPATWSW